MEYSSPQLKRRYASIVFGRVIESAGLHEHKVLFANSEVKTCKSCKLRIVPDNEIPPSLRPSAEIDMSLLSPHGESSNPSHENDDDTIDDHGNQIVDNGEEVGEVVEEQEEEERVEMLTGNNDIPQEDALTYEQKLQAAKQKITEMTGDTVTMRNGNKTMLWRVIENHFADFPERADHNIGLKPEVLDEIMKDPEMVASSLFMKLMFGESFVSTLVKMNRAIQTYNHEVRLNRPIRLFSKAEFLRVYCSFDCFCLLCIQWESFVEG